MIRSLPANLKKTIHQYRHDKEYGELVRTSFFALLVRAIGVFTGFLVTLFTSRYYGAGALGIVSICIAILSIASVFARLGLDVALMKFIAEYSAVSAYGKIRSVYNSSMKLILPATLTVTFILFVLAPWMASDLFHKPYLVNILRINACLTLPLVIMLVNSECIRGLKKIKSYTFFQSVSVSAIAAVLLFFVRFYKDSKEIPVLIQFVSIILSGLLSYFLWIYFSRPGKHAKEEAEKPAGLFAVSSPMFLTMLMQLIMSWGATLILASWVSESDIGVYNALVRISVVTNVTILAINGLSMPRFAESFALKNFDLLKKHSDEATRLIFITSLPIFAALFLFPSIILAIFGREFPGHENELFILLIGQLIVTFSGLPSQILNMTGRQHLLRNIAIFSAVVNIGASFILIPPYGITGACYAQLFGMFTYNLLCIVSVKKELGFTTFFKLRKA
jgi:O-antigen/teichoic acid export membrane protein